MFSKIDSILVSEDKKRLFYNFIYLFILQGSNYVLPFITLPYLIRVLGADKFGLYAFSQAFVSYFLTFTDFGFYLSAVREVAINRDNPEKLSEIFWSITIIKLILMTLSTCVMTFIIFYFSKFRHDWLFYYLTFGMVLGNCMFPGWFFQGMEKMKYITILNMLSKLIFTISIFIFVKNQSDFMYVPLLNSLGYIIAGLISLKILFSDFKLKFVIPKIKVLWKSVKESSQFFLSRVSVIFYTSNNAFILGLFTNNHMVGYYATAEKLNFALKSMYYPLSDNLYPYMSKEKNKPLFKKIFIGASLFNTILCLLCCLFASQIIRLIFGPGLGISSNIFKILSFVAIFSVPATLMGYPLLGAYGNSKLVNMSYILGSVLHVIGLSVLALFSMINVYSIAGMVLTTEIIILLIRSYYVTQTNFK